MKDTPTSIRPFADADGPATLGVFLRAIRETASTHYDAQQIAAWASDDIDQLRWTAKRAAANTWVAERAGTVIGFTDIDDLGHVDMMFVDPTAGRRGVATALLAHVSSIARDNGIAVLTVDASVTARPFFERHGFEVVREQRVERRGARLTNFRMQQVLR